MGDMTMVMRAMCKSIAGPRSFDVRGYEQHGLFSEAHTPTCSCPAFTYSKTDPPVCKHIKKIEKDLVCGWHENVGPEVMETPAICPRCGNEAVMAQVAV